MERQAHCLFSKRIFTQETTECLNIIRTIIGLLLIFCNTGLELDINQEDIWKRCNCLSYSWLGYKLSNYNTCSSVATLSLFTGTLTLSNFLIGFKGQKQYGLNRFNVIGRTRIWWLARNQTTTLMQWQILSVLMTLQSTITVPLW